ncbi:SOS-response transcriptional repressor, LexA [Sulfobacillus acidophilus DSM 10332]|uniref:LexA repressor n=1 Tax=Sulfobacillus acidophilus (strain ATCC 700253 / DSM 10332 / NAL) TaxID=679936 RepID=G8U080_SULAD|nr:SOS-response transcriptional repressor, LexA [Sulfobacillus acidophilus DSM 10332]
MRRSAAERQQDILQFIQRYLQRYGYPPSVREIGAAVGLKSTASVARYLKRLEEGGLISHPPAKRRAWRVERDRGEPPVPVPLIGRITAGQPILAVENVEDTWSVTPSLFSRQPDYFLRVKGDSMIGVGIFDGDLVAVEAVNTADSGDIVIAVIGEEATVKTLDITPHGLRLLPANPRYQPIEHPYIQVIGRVIGLVRTY